MSSFTIRAPASSANLGPAFDCLALALDLWNEAGFVLGESGVAIEGEGAGSLPTDENNLILQAFRAAYQAAGEAQPDVGLRAHNRIPLASGLGSSAAATACGLLAANRLLSDRHSLNELLHIGAALEGHADNLAAALYGGCVLVTQNEEGYAVQHLAVPPLNAVVVLPALSYSTQAAREELQQSVPLADAVFNLGQAMQLVEALRSGDIPSLAAAIQDRLHQSYRLKLIPGGREALEAARAAGAAAAISGAGPGLIAFTEAGCEKAVSEALRAPFGERGIDTQLYLLKSTEQGAGVS